MTTRQTYIPPLRFQALTPLYDPLLAWVMREATFKRRLIEVLRPEPGDRLLDLGCGTGTLTVWLREAYPAVPVFGLDIDTAALRLARAKAAPYAAGVQLQQASATALPYQNQGFAWVTSSLMFHHLPGPQKSAAFREVARVLRPGGTFLLLDFGKPRHAYAKGLATLLKGVEETEENFAGQLPELMQTAGLQDVEELAIFLTVVGDLSLYRARKQTALGRGSLGSCAGGGGAGHGR